MANPFSGLFQNTGPTAPYPASGYPAEDFFGAVALQPGGSASSGNAAPLTPKDTKTLLITVGALVLGGYALWHLYYR